MTKLEILIDGMAVITPPENWTTGARGRTADGKPAAPMNAHAVQFCALGALDRAGGDGLSLGDSAVCKALARALPVDWLPLDHAGARVAQYNNSHDHAAILAVFAKAIEIERGRTKTDISVFKRMLEPNALAGCQE